MKLLFSHDHIFLKYDEKFYSNGGLSYTVLKRYINIFENITVISRNRLCLEKGDIEGLTLASGNGANFIAVPDFKNLKNLSSYYEAMSIVDSQVRNSDLIIARVPSSISYLVIKAAIKYKKPYLIEVVGCAWDSNKNHGSFLGKLLAPYAYLKMKKFVKNAPYTIYITKSFLQSRYPNLNLTAVCPNVRLEKVDSIVLEKRIEKIKTLNPEKIIKLGLIGSLDVNYKGHEIAILVVKRLKESGLNVCIEFLGQGKIDRWLDLSKEYGVDNNIVFKGSLPSGDAVYDWIDSLDFMIQPSSAEAQGRSIIEGMSRGCPVVSTKVGGIVELIDSDLLVNAGDHLGLANIIIDLVESPGKLEKVALNNFNEAKNYYTKNIEQTRNKFLNNFKEKYHE